MVGSVGGGKGSATRKFREEDGWGVGEREAENGKSIPKGIC